jgi:hypothetical protein
MPVSDKCKTRFSVLLSVLTASFFSLPASGAEMAISIPVQLTHPLNFDPSPSPDGKRLVFITSISRKEQLFTMSVDGSNIVQITRDEDNYHG